MLRFAVCDDESLGIQEILGHLPGYMDTKPHIPYQSSAFQDGESLLESDCNFDVIFLDIRMEKPDGIETARLREQALLCHMKERDL